MRKGDVLGVLRHVYDPDYANRSIVEMSLVNEGDVKIEEDKIEVAYGVTAPFCPFSAAIGVND